MVLDLGSLTAFADANGNAITIADDTTSADGSTRQIDAIESDGTTPVHITVYYAQQSNTTKTDLLDMTANPPSDSNDGVSDEPGTLEPSVAVAATPTTETVAWAPPADDDAFALLVDGREADSGATPSFTLIGLAPDTAHTLTLQSTNSSASSAATPSSTSIEGCATTRSDLTTDLSDWNVQATTSRSGNVLTASGLLTYTPGGGQQSAATREIDPVALADAGTPDKTWSGQGAAPQLRLAIDFNADGTTDGGLVGDGGQNAEYALDSGAPAFVTQAAPGISATLADWVSAFPDAQITGVGFGLTQAGSGTLESLTVGCTSYEFNLGSDGETDFGDGLSTSATVSVTTLPLPSAPAASATRSLSKRATITRPDDPELPPAIKANSADFTYRTFIPYDTLQDSPNIADRGIVAACLFTYFNFEAGKAAPEDLAKMTFIGDNRSFESPADDAHPQQYRTSMSIHVDWSDPTKSDALTRDVGDTQIVDDDTHQVLEEKRASTDHMIKRDSVQTDDYFATTLFESAHDPFCPAVGDAGAIAYNARLQMFRSGLVIVTGYRATMPSHEGWVRWNGSTRWSPVFRYEATNLSCLATAFISAAKHSPGYCYGAIGGASSISADRWVSVAAGWSTTVAATKSGISLGWGRTDPWSQLIAADFHGAIDCTVLEPEYTPGRQDPAWLSKRITQVSISDTSATALEADGTVDTWGSDTEYWHDDPTGGGYYVPVVVLGRTDGALGPAPVDSTEKFTSVQQYGPESAALGKDGNIYLWGAGLEGWYQDADGNWLSKWVFQSAVPVARATGGAAFVSFALTSGAVYALDAAGHAWMLGFDPYSGDELSSWTRIDGGVASFTRVGGTDAGAMLADADGNLWFWGAYLTADEEAEADATVPIQLDTGSTFTEIRQDTSSGSVDLVDSSGAAYNVGSLLEPSLGRTMLDAFAVSGIDAPVAALFGPWAALDTAGELWELNRSTGQWENLGWPPVTVNSPAPADCRYLT